MVKRTDTCHTGDAMNTPSSTQRPAPHWTQDETRCTTCDYRYEIVLTDAANSMIDGDHARKRRQAFERGEHWIKRNPSLCVAVYDRMARVGAPYEWHYVPHAAVPGWVVTKLKSEVSS